MKRALVNDGGGLILSVQQHPALWSQADDSAHHERRYWVSKLQSKVVELQDFESNLTHRFSAYHP